MKGTRVGHNSNTYILLFYYLLFYNFLPAAAPKLALKLSARFPYKKHCCVGQPGSFRQQICVDFGSTPPIPCRPVPISMAMARPKSIDPPLLLPLPLPLPLKTRHKWRNCVKVEKRFLAKCAALNNAIKRQTCRYFFALAAIIQSRTHCSLSHRHVRVYPYLSESISVLAVPVLAVSFSFCVFLVIQLPL